MQRNVAIFINPRAGKGKASSLLHSVLQRLDAEKIISTIYSDTFPDSKWLQTFTDILIIGGDGSINFVVNYYKDVLRTIPISIIAGGTGNDFIRSLYGVLSIDRQIENLIKGTPTKIDIGVCNGQYFLNGVGIGFDGKVVETMLSRKWFSGHLAYYTAVIPLIFSYKETPAKITGNVVKHSVPVFMITIANGRTFGGGFNITPKADLQDGVFDICLIEKTTIFQRLINLPKIERGKHLHLPFVKYFHEKRIGFQSETLLPAHIDGEFVKSKDFQISLLPEHFIFRK